ncbi:MAG: hypothetical protein ACPGCM_19660, partial [Alteromonas oceani]
MLATSGDWDSVYNWVQSDSATNNTDYNRTTFVNASGDTISGDLNVTGHLEGTTAVFTSITALSSVVDVIDIKVRELSGFDIIDGDFGVEGSGSFDTDVYVTHGDIIFGDSGLHHDVLHSEEDVEHLSKQDVRDFKSTQVSVYTNSANWDSVYNTTKTNSAYWVSTHTSVLANSTNWDNVYTDVSITSGNWDSVYSWVSSDSATNNTDYNRTTFVNTSGDTIAGDLTIIDNFKVHGDTHLRGDLIVDGNVWFTSGLLGDGISINLGDRETDKIVYVGKVGSDIIPTNSLIYKLGNESNRWSDVYTNNVDALSTITAGSDIKITTGDLIFGDANVAHGLAHTLEDLEHLSKQDVRDFKSVKTSVHEASGDWDSTHTSVLATSSNWESTHASVLTTSSNWDSTHASVLATSADWDSTHASVLATSSDWNSTHASVLVTSADWDSTHASVLATSGDWDSVYSWVSSDSATNNTDYNRTTFVNASGDTIAGDLNITGHLEGTTAVFTSITALSSVVDVIDIKVRELSGYDIIDGDLSIGGNVTTDQQLNITHGDIVFGDSGLHHGVLHSEEEIEHLSKQDVRDFKSTNASVLATSSDWDSVYASVLATSSDWDSTHASVLATSTNWDNAYTDVSTTSANWDSTYTSVLANSSDWNNVYTDVSTTSAKWDSVYSWVKSDSATNNSIYNETTYVNVAGDTMTGALTVDAPINTKMLRTNDDTSKLELYGGKNNTTGSNITLYGGNQGNQNYNNRIHAATDDFIISDVYESTDGMAPWMFRVKTDTNNIIINGLHEYDQSSVLSVFGKTTIDGDIKITGDINTSGEIIFNTTEPTVTLSRWDVLDFRSTESTVNTNSADWDSTHASVLATSSNWDSTHASVLATSADWDSTHASVL